MKNPFYSILKAPFAFKISKVLSRLLDHAEKTVSL